jgi:CBS domain-containing protein
MKWFDLNPEPQPELPEIENISAEIPAISQYLDAFRLPDTFRRFESDTFPVINLKGKIVGIVSEYDLARNIKDWTLADDGYTKRLKVADIMTHKVWTETEHTNVQNLIKRIPEMHTRVIPIVDEEERYTGKCITRTALVRYLTGRVKPQSLGGLATPLGVYITDGLHQAGAGTPGLILTGAVFAILAAVIRIISLWISKTFVMPTFLLSLLEIFLFLLFLRFSAFSKIHAAEHKTINAIERGVPLTIEAVKTQSRIHNRCGTNIFVFVLGILAVMFLSTGLINEKYVFLKFVFSLTGFLIVMTYWKKIGNLVQKYFTTSEPGEKQLNSGIQAGEELLMLHKRDVNHVYPTFLTRIWNMGLIQLGLSFFLVMWLLEKYVLHFF